MASMPLKDINQGVIACTAALAICFGAFVFSHTGSQSVQTFSAPSMQATSTLTAQAVVPRYSQSSVSLRGSGLSISNHEDVADGEVVAVVTSSPLHFAGLTTMCLSAFLAATGVVLRIFSSVQRNATAPVFGSLEAVQVEESFAMAAAAAKKARKDKNKKGPKASKEEKAERPPIVLTPKEVFYKMRKAVLRRAKKPTKTTGRVCQILGKVDNRKARSISFSHRRTKRLQMVNLQWRRLWWEEGKCFVMLRLSTKGIKTVTKYGLHQAAIKFGLDLTKHINGTSERKYIKYLPEKEKKLALIRGARLRHASAVRWAKLNDLELPPPLPQKVKASKEPATIAMAISHGRKVPLLSKPADQRKALLRSLTTELIRHGRIKTTFVRAKAIRKHVDHMITLAKEGTLHTRRQAIAYIYDKDLVKTLFEQAPERYATREGGYTRILRTMPRKGDCAKMCYIELV